MVQWYYQWPAGRQEGPVSADELRKLADVGTVTPDTPVRRRDDVEWTPARQVKGLFNEPHVAEPSGRASLTLMQKVRGLLAKLVPKMRHGPSKPGAGSSLPPSLPGQRNRILIPALLSVLIAVASLSVVVQVCILHRLSSIPTLDVNVENPTLDVNVENSELDVNVENSELDVRMRDHWIIEADPIPVTIVK